MHLPLGFLLEGAEAREDAGAGQPAHQGGPRAPGQHREEREKVGTWRCSWASCKRQGVAPPFPLPLHSPSCPCRRRPRRARSRPPSTCSRRCPAPTKRRSRAAAASAAAFSRLGRAAATQPPLRGEASSAPGAGGGAERGGRRGGRRGPGRAHPIAAELRPRPGAQRSAARHGAARRGSARGSSRKRRLGRRARVREQRATNRRRLRGPDAPGGGDYCVSMAAARRAPPGRPRGRLLPVLPPLAAAPPPGLSDRWLPARPARGPRAHPPQH